MSGMSQVDQLRAHFDAGHSLTVLEALQKFGIYALSQRVTNLRQEGYPVESVMVELPNGKRIARYSKLTVAYG